MDISINFIESMWKLQRTVNGNIEEKLTKCLLVG